jgi:hypothetical protein
VEASVEDFAKSLGNMLAAATTPSSLAKKCFRVELWVTGSGGRGPKSLPKEGSGVSLVNQNFRGNFLTGVNKAAHARELLALIATYGRKRPAQIRQKPRLASDE